MSHFYFLALLYDVALSPVHMPATISKQHCKKQLATLLSVAWILLLPKLQQCRSNIRLCSIRQCCFDIVAGVDGALQTVLSSCVLAVILDSDGVQCYSHSVVRLTAGDARLQISEMKRNCSFYLQVILCAVDDWILDAGVRQRGVIAECRLIRLSRRLCCFDYTMHLTVELGPLYRSISAAMPPVTQKNMKQMLLHAVPQMPHIVFYVLPLAK